MSQVQTFGIDLRGFIKHGIYCLGSHRHRGLISGRGTKMARKKRQFTGKVSDERTGFKRGQAENKGWFTVHNHTPKNSRDLQRQIMLVDGTQRNMTNW